MAHHLNVILDDKLHRAVTNAAKERGLTVSHVVRDTLRQAIEEVTARDSGFREGFNAGFRKMNEAVADAFVRNGGK